MIIMTKKILNLVIKLKINVKHIANLEKMKKSHIVKENKPKKIRELKINIKIFLLIFVHFANHLDIVINLI